jgi:hypothetical protein
VEGEAQMRPELLRREGGSDITRTCSTTGIAVQSGSCRSRLTGPDPPAPEPGEDQTDAQGLAARLGGDSTRVGRDLEDLEERGLVMLERDGQRKKIKARPVPMILG